MKKALIVKWKGHVLAFSQDYLKIGDQYYFPRKDIDWNFLIESSHKSFCVWKGEASYFDLKDNAGSQAEKAAWSYEQTKDPQAAYKDLISWSPVVSIEPAGFIDRFKFKFKK